MKQPTLSVIIVTWNSEASIAGVVEALDRELGPGDEILVVDNASGDATVERAVAASGAVAVIQTSANLGFAEGANRGAASARGELLVFLNPDAVPQPGFASAIRRPLVERRGWTLWQGLVLSDDSTINSAGGEVHFTGISWAGRAGSPAATAPTEPREIGFASGACLAIPRRTWNALGGFPSDYFMYCEDLDLSLRAWWQGGVVGIEPSAVVIHDYEFDKGPSKWRYLERNRISTVIRTFPGSLLAVCLPAMLAAEIAILVAAASGGWLRPKLRSYLDLLGSSRRLMAQRRMTVTGRSGRDGVLAALQPQVTSTYLAVLSSSRLAQHMLDAYWRIAVRRPPRSGAGRDAGSGGVSGRAKANS